MPRNFGLPRRDRWRPPTLTEIRWAMAGAVHVEEPRPDTAWISIHNPSRKAVSAGASASGWGAVLSLHFWDTEDAGMPFGERLVASAFGRDAELCSAVGDTLFSENDWPWRPALAADADEIVRFLSGLPQGVEKLIVSCEHARSRSRAVAEWAARRCPSAELIGDRTKAAPNKRLTSLLDAAARRADP